MREVGNLLNHVSATRLLTLTTRAVNLVTQVVTSALLQRLVTAKLTRRNLISSLPKQCYEQDKVYL
jgi:hypothetical protein